MLSRARRTCLCGATDFSHHFGLFIFAAFRTFLPAMSFRNSLSTSPEGLPSYPFVGTSEVASWAFGTSASSIWLSSSKMMQTSCWIVLNAVSTVPSCNPLHQLPFTSFTWYFDSPSAEAYIMVSAASPGPYRRSSSSAFLIVSKTHSALHFSSTIEISTRKSPSNQLRRFTISFFCLYSRFCGSDSAKLAEALRAPFLSTNF